MLCRDGVERVEVTDGGNVEHLYDAIASQLHIPHSDLRLSKDPKLVSVEVECENEMFV